MAGGQRKCSSGSSTTISLPVIEGTPAEGAPKLNPKLKKSGATRWRIVVLVAVHVVIGLHVVHWLIAGRTPSPVEPSEAMALVRDGVVNLGLIFFALAILSTLILGRWFCGWGCHVVALQDLCYGLMRRIGIRPKPFRSRLLVYVPFVLAFYMFLWPAVYRWGLAPLVPAWDAPPMPPIQIELTTDDFWATFPGIAVAIPFFLVCGFACVYFLGAKGFCTYGCPYGGFFAPAEQFAPGRIRVNDDCEHCGHCTAVCTSNVRVHEEVAAYGMVVDPGCMKCMDCVSVCPNDALSFSFGPLPSKSQLRVESAPIKKFDLSWPEEIALSLLFLGSFVAVRGAYGLIPMLMAAGVAACITFLGWKAWRVLRDRNASFHRTRLRIAGRTTAAGRVFIGGAIVILAVTAHTAVAQWVHRSAGQADGLVTVARGRVFSQSPMMLDERMLAHVDRAIAGYERSQPFWRGGIGLAHWPGLDVRLGWLEACRHDFAAAEARLTRHLETWGAVDGIARDVVLLGALQVEPRRAIDWGLAYVDRNPTHFQTAQQVATLLIEDGRPGEAIEMMEGLAERTTPRPDARANARAREDHLQVLRILSIVLLDAGDRERGIEVVRRTLEIDDTSPGGWFVLGRALAEVDRVDEAMEAFERAWALSPAPSTAEFAASVLESKGRIMEAAIWRQRLTGDGP